jgi:hypothetical protein
MICNVLWFVSMDFPLSTLFYWILLRKGFSFIKSILSTLFFIWIRTAAGYHCGVRAHSVDNYSGIYECSCWWIAGQRAFFIFSLCCSLVVNIDDWTYFHNKDLKKREYVNYDIIFKMTLDSGFRTEYLRSSVFLVNRHLTKLYMGLFSQFWWLECLIIERCYFILFHLVIFTYFLLFTINLIDPIMLEFLTAGIILEN